MGLQSSLTTALTGLQAAETTIDVTGNNVANSNTAGFKESSVLFATQFLRTLSIGSAPTDDRGGTNPRQIGLGVKVAAITPDFSQGTIEISSNPLDVAIQGEGFLIVQSSQGELYTRAGQLNTNSANEIVTPGGNRVLGYTVDEDFVIDQSARVPISIPLGGAAVAQATENAFFTGTLSPSAAIGDTPEITTSQVLGNALIEAPTDPWTLADISVPDPPPVGGVTTMEMAAGNLPDGTYQYRIVYATQAIGTTTVPDDVRAQEGAPSLATTAITISPGGPTGSIDIDGIPEPPNAEFTHIRIYRFKDSDPSELAGEITVVPGTGTYSFSDIDIDASSVALSLKTLATGNYSYYATFWDAGAQVESRPSPVVGSLSVSSTGRRILVTNIPQPAGAQWDEVRLYRNTSTSTSDYRLVDSVAVGQTVYVDSMEDSDIGSNQTLNFDGPGATSTTLLSDVLIRDGATTLQPFQNPGTLSFSARRGGRSLEAKEFTVGAATTVGELVQFMQQAMGIHLSSDLPTEPFPGAVSSPGVQLTSDGAIEITSNHGLENALSVGLTAFEYLEDGATSPSTVAIDFSQTQAALGEGATADFIVYDSLGIPINVSVSTVLESRTPNETTYRWFAFSPDNEPVAGVSTAIGNGIIKFDSEGNVIPGEPPTLNIGRNITASQSPLEVTLDFSEVSGLAAVDALGEPVSNLNVSRQDGFPPGVLTSFIVTESGLIRGVFSNGTQRPLGQLVMARFANNTGLTSVGDNLFAVGVNSGNPVFGEPGADGLGTLLGGAVELSNTDIGQNLIELILASTQYRGNARVITTTQELLDELLALSR